MANASLERITPARRRIEGRQPPSQTAPVRRGATAAGSPRIAPEARFGGVEELDALIRNLSYLRNFGIRW